MVVNIPSSAAAGLLLALGSAAHADLQWGVNGHPFTAYPGIPFEEQLDLVASLGMTSYRVNVTDIGRAAELAVLVEKAKTRGIDILPVITPGDIDLDEMNEDELYETSFELAALLVSRFKDDIRAWELGNELEVHAIIQPCEMRDDGTQYPCEWGHAGGVGSLDYYGPRWRKVSAVLKGLSEGAISADPTVRKAIGTAGWGHVGAFERMAQDGIEWDVSVWHMYGEDPEWAFKLLAGHDKPIWVTELNHPYGSQRDESEQAEGLRLAMDRLSELKDEYQVEAAHIYELLDEPYWAPDFEAHMGLVRVVPRPGGGWMTGEPKPAYFAVREVIRGPISKIEIARSCKLDDAGAQTSLAERQASYAFCLVLGTTTDAGLMNGQMEAGEEKETSIFETLMALLRSVEFKQTYVAYTLTDEEYVRLLYRLLLVREPDGEGLSAYSRQLNAGHMTRENVAFAIMTSSEFAERHPLLFAKEIKSGATHIPRQE